ncbi:MAG: PRA1 family protein [Methanomicrobiales archaeon]|nr:PRA1 family protein [Methanomicrobiales archaeon]
MNLTVSPAVQCILAGTIVFLAVFGLSLVNAALPPALLFAGFIVIVLWYYFQNRGPETERDRAEGEAVLGAGLITFVAVMNMEWIVWAIGLAFLFMIHGSLERIERRLDHLERKIPPP